MAALTRKERREAAFWLSRHLAAALKAADLTHFDLATKTEVSIRTIGALIKDGATGKSLAETAAMHPKNAGALLEFAREALGIGPRDCARKPCPLCLSGASLTGPAGGAGQVTETPQFPGPRRKRLGSEAAKRKKPAT